LMMFGAGFTALSITYAHYLEHGYQDADKLWLLRGAMIGGLLLVNGAIIYCNYRKGDYLEEDVEAWEHASDGDFEDDCYPK
jgi:hypothetical protein